jgi:hypothetical protein
LEYKHKLDAESDALFLKYGPRESLWFQKPVPGDTIVCCNQCRRIFYQDDWTLRCPVCKTGEPLYFVSANQLLLHEPAGAADAGVNGSAVNGAGVRMRLRAERVRIPAEDTNDDRTTALREEELAARKSEWEDVDARLHNLIIASRIPDMPSVCAGFAAFAFLFFAGCVISWVIPVP